MTDKHTPAETAVGIEEMIKYAADRCLVKMTPKRLDLFVGFCYVEHFSKYGRSITDSTVDEQRASVINVLMELGAFRRKDLKKMNKATFSKVDEEDIWNFCVYIARSEPFYVNQNMGLSERALSEMMLGRRHWEW